MNTYTPGPWTLKQDGVLMHQTLIIPGNRQAPIGVVYGNSNDIENGANARLIAAAPELLQALDNLRSAAYWIVGGGEFWDWVMDKTMPVAAAKELDELREMMMQAKDAIAKAKGEL